MSAETCCPTEVGPVVSNYEPKGEVVQLNGVDLYTVGTPGKKAVVVVYDIFGFHPNTQQVADKIAEAGYYVAMYDFFKGKPFPQSPWPPEAGFGALGEWVQQVGQFDTLKGEVQAVFEFVKSKGAESVGIIGFCWGAKIAIQAANKLEGYSAMVGPHPSFLKPEDAAEAKVPIAILASRDDAEGLVAFKEELDKNPQAEKNFYKVFENMHHGFMGARGDWSIPEQAARASEGVNDTIAFFNKNL